MNLNRRGIGEKIAGISAILLFVFMFFDWFGVKLSNTSNLLFAIQSIEPGESAWEALEYIPIVLVITTSPRSPWRCCASRTLSAGLLSRSTPWSQFSASPRWHWSSSGSSTRPSSTSKQPSRPKARSNCRSSLLCWRQRESPLVAFWQCGKKVSPSPIYARVDIEIRACIVEGEFVDRANPTDEHGDRAPPDFCGCRSAVRLASPKIPSPKPWSSRCCIRPTWPRSTIWTLPLGASPRARRSGFLRARYIRKQRGSSRRPGRAGSTGANSRAQGLRDSAAWKSISKQPGGAGVLRSEPRRTRRLCGRPVSVPPQSREPR
jgi:hypothetical protein